jgi:hypothetical protein
MKRNFTRLAGILTGLPFVCLTLTGQTAIRNAVQTAERFDRVRAESPEARRGVDAPALQLRTDVPEAWLRADEKPWPDSVVTYTPTGDRMTKVVYTYDAAGNNTQYEYFVWEGGKWANSEKTESSYDAAGNTTLTQTYRWENGQWIASYRDTYTYDAAGNRNSSESYEWEDNRWVGRRKSLSTYDAATGREVYESYREENGQWVADYKYVIEYDEAGHQLLSESYTGENNAWVGSYKSTRVYDSEGLLVLSTTYFWQNNQWESINGSTYYHEGRTVSQDNVHVIRNVSINMSTSIGINVPSFGIVSLGFYPAEDRLVYDTAYDGNGNLRQVNVSGVRGEIGSIVIEYERNVPVSFEAYDRGELYDKVTRQYDAKGNIILHELYRWDYQKNRIITVNKEVSAYDANGYRTLSEYYTGDESGNGWVGTSKYEYEYDAAGKQLSYAYYNWVDGNWSGNYRATYDERDESGRIVVYSNYAWQSGRWEKSSYTVYYPNSSSPDGTEAVAATAEAWSHAGSLHVRTAQPAALSVYTLSGTLLTRQTLAAGETVIPLPQGIYIVRIGNTAHKIAITK